MPAGRTPRVPFLLPDDQVVGDEPAPPPEGPAVEFPTLAMVEVYEKQGLFERARSVLCAILDRDPTNPAAMEALSGLEPAGLHDSGDPPARYGRVALALLAVGPRTLYAYWEVTSEARRNAEAALGVGSGEIRLELRSFLPVLGAVRTSARAIEVGGEVGERFLHDFEAGALHCAAIGLFAGGRFLPVAQSRTIATPRDAPAGDLTVEWMPPGRIGPGGPAAGGGDPPPPEPTRKSPQSRNT